MGRVHGSPVRARGFVIGASLALSVILWSAMVYGMGRSVPAGLVYSACYCLVMIAFFYLLGHSVVGGRDEKKCFCRIEELHAGEEAPPGEGGVRRGVQEPPPVAHP